MSFPDGKEEWRAHTIGEWDAAGQPKKHEFRSGATDTGRNPASVPAR